MRQFKLLADDINVKPLLAELDAQPELWNVREERRRGESPHREADDIWLRYRDPAELHGPDDFRGEHESVWYPAALKLPALAGIIGLLGDIIRPTRAGGVLMTRIPPGKQVYPHHDRGTWHAEYYTTKVYIPLRANAQCVNFCGDDWEVMAPGTVWQFNNLVDHSVVNGGQTERITLICCYRVE